MFSVHLVDNRHKSRILIIHDQRCQNSIQEANKKIQILQFLCLIVRYVQGRIKQDEEKVNALDYYHIILKIITQYKYLFMHFVFIVILLSCSILYEKRGYWTIFQPQLLCRTEYCFQPFMFFECQMEKGEIPSFSQKTIYSGFENV